LMNGAIASSAAEIGDEREPGEGLIEPRLLICYAIAE
jgi:hypothetical protein